MRVLIRADASIKIGSGHVMRCLTLADELRRRGAEVMFVCRSLTENMCDYIEDNGFKVLQLSSPPSDPGCLDWNPHAEWLGVHWEQDASETLDILDVEGGRFDWLVVDNYALDSRWEGRLRAKVARIMVIDDLADRHHDCNLLLDQNLYEAMETRYEKLVSVDCKKLLGPRYALLRPEFVVARKRLRWRNGHIRRVLVFFGGVDATNETEKALRALANIDMRLIDVDVVVSSANPHKERIKSLCAVQNGFHYHCQVNNMAELMAGADLAIGAGGTTTWERCVVGLPAVVWIIADNQSETAHVLANRNIIKYLGYYNQVTERDIVAVINELLRDEAILRMLHENSIKLMGEESDGVEQTVSYILNKDGK